MTAENRLTRRRLLVGGAAVTGTTLAGLYWTSNNVSATTEIEGEFSVPDHEEPIVDEQVSDVRLTADVTGGWTANVDVTKYVIRLRVGSSQDNLSLIARVEEDGLGMDNADIDETLEGSLLSGPWTADDFQPDSGTVSQPIVGQIELDIFRGEDMIAMGTATESFTIQVTDEQITIEPELSGEGEITIQTQ
jgi:hypothetical protein